MTRAELLAQRAKIAADFDQVRQDYDRLVSEWEAAEQRWLADLERSALTRLMISDLLDLCDAALADPAEEEQAA